MVKRRTIKRSKPVRKVVEEDIDDDDLDIVDEDFDDADLDDDDDDVVDDDDEEEEVAPAPRRKSRRVVEEEIADEDEDPAPVKKSKKAADPEPVKAKAEKTEKVAVAEIKPVDQLVAENVFTQLLGSLDEGKSIIITALGKNKFQLVVGDPVQMGMRKLSGAEAYRQMVNPEYLEWKERWGDMTYEQKVKHAKKIGAKWEEHENPNIEIIRVTQAVRAKEGIEKYKPEYRTRAARAAFKSG